MENKFYVYQLRRADSNEPFYIGKGVGRRAWTHTEQYELSKPTHKTFKIKKSLSEGIEIVVDILESELTEDNAFEKEMFYIKKYGRLDNCTGCLVNHTDGGKGGVGIVVSEKSKKKNSETNKGKVFSEETKSRMRIAKKGIMVVTDLETGLHVSITSDEYHSNKDRYRTKFHGKIPTVDEFGKVHMVSKDDLRYINGELKNMHTGKPGANKGKKFDKTHVDNMIISGWSKKPEIWIRASEFYKYYIDRTGNTARRLSKITNIKESSLVWMIKKFVSGWNPNTDTNWNKWRSTFDAI